MKKIWIQKIGAIFQTQDKPELSVKLGKTLHTSFKGNLQQWEHYCKAVASSKFLMGEISNQTFEKVCITWVIRPEVVEGIHAGEFTLGDRGTKLDQQLFQCQEVIQDLDSRRNTLKHQLAALKIHIEQQHRDEALQNVQQIDTQHQEQLKREFEAEMQQRQDALGDEFRNNGWQGKFIEASYKFFLQSNLQSKVFQQASDQDFDTPVTATQEQDEKLQHLKGQLAEVDKQHIQAQTHLQQLRTEKESIIAISPVGFRKASDQS